ncbi:MAG TPA: hypothetical protein VD788_00360 [Candidatus Polarisedimenticolaceae bacterium]|nr:hypothetical protein [Candidatus Polarisedimenticolaceae bacterium]
MLGKRPSSVRAFVVFGGALLVPMAGIPVVLSAEQAIDLDGNPLNGKESRVVTRVLQSYPVKIENVIYNNSHGKAFIFDWSGAGPGGFGSFVVAGPDVGTKWEWTTLSQVYSILSPATFAPEDRGLPTVGGQPGGIQAGGDPGVFSLPGKSIYPTTVTVSSASLTSSLVTFFSPEQEVASCGGSFSAGRFEQTISNRSGGAVSFSVEQQDCCPEPQMTICQDGCRFYLTDPDNCGGCGIECGEGEICSAGSCELVCTGGTTECDGACVDLSNDPLNCGACGNQCEADQFCGEGTCQDICAPGLTLCGDLCVDLTSDPLNCGACGNTCGSNDICAAGLCETCRPPRPTACDNECVNTNTDPYHCGGCGMACDFTNCPSTGSGTCSQGTSCVCLESGGSTAEAVLYSPIDIPGALEPRAPRRQRIGRAGPRAPAAIEAAATRGLQAIEAPVCDLEPLEMTIEDGETFSRCLDGARIGKEVFTTAQIQRDGEIIGGGPCAVIVPDTQAVIPPFLPAPVDVDVLDQSGDGLLQPGESGTLWLTVANLGDSPFDDPVAVLSSPPDSFNPAPVVFANDASAYGGFPAFVENGDCTNEPQFESRTNLVGFEVTIPEEQEADVGRVFQLSLEGSADGPAVVMPVVIGIGAQCDPAVTLDGETFDGLAGFLEPVNAMLRPRNGDPQFSPGDFNRGKTVPLKMRLICGERTLGPTEIDPTPEIVGLVHDSLGPQPLAAINADNGANPDNPFFVCGTNRCEFQLRTTDLPVGDLVIEVKLPDSRVFHAGFTLRP